MQRVIADTGFFVALGRRADRCHPRAARFADRFEGRLITTSPVIVESCHFLNVEWRLDLLRVIEEGRLEVAEVPVSSYHELAVTIRKYADCDIDFADASLVWLAEHTGLREILTLDVRDFSVFRLKNGKRFELVDWS